MPGPIFNLVRKCQSVCGFASSLNFPGSHLDQYSFHFSALGKMGHGIPCELLLLSPAMDLLFCSQGQGRFM